jgi:hypothetical protein
MLQAKGVFTVAAIGWSAARLHVGSTPWLRTYGAQERRRVKCPGTHFLVVRLYDHATALGPILLQLENQILKT